MSATRLIQPYEVEHLEQIHEAQDAVASIFVDAATLAGAFYSTLKTGEAATHFDSFEMAKEQVSGLGSMVMRKLFNRQDRSA